MNNFMKKYVKICNACKRVKTVRYVFYEKLISLSTSTRLWNYITLDFIINLSKFKFCLKIDICDSILVIINRLTKIIHYVAYRKNLNFRQFSQFLIKIIIWLHEILKIIINDREKIFIFHFWRRFSKQLKIDQRFFTIFHSQTNE